MNCNYCEFRCDLGSAKGICGRYELVDGSICETEPMHFIPPTYYEIEEMPFFHAMPGAVVAQTGQKVAMQPVITA